MGAIARNETEIPAIQCGSDPPGRMEPDMVGPSRARDILSALGWLSRQPEDFQEEVFRRAVPVRYAAGDAVYQLGDPVGGIYGVVSGALVASVAPPRAVPQILHVLTPGGWTGEGSFLSREPRRIELRAAMETAAVYLPLDSMDQIAGRDPLATRRFTQILLINLDIIMRAFYDMQDPDERRRIARAIRRIAVRENTPLPIAQSALGMLSNVSRKTVNAALKEFSAAGWVRTAYRTVTVTNMKRLTRFAESAD